MLNLQELMDKIKSGDVPSTSEFNLMNEKRQTLPKGIGLNRFTYKYQKQSRILFSLQMAIPFNPETGEADERFNPNQKWRPPVSPRTADLLVKAYCSNNEKAKDVFQKRAGVSDWDVSDLTALNDVDFKVLRAYRTPLILTVDATTINDPAITGQDFGIAYSVDVKRDLDTGQVIGDMPPIMKIGALMSAITFKEVGQLQEAIEAKDPSIYKNERPFISKTAISVATETDSKDWVSKILGDSLISAVRPKNMILGFEFGLTSSQSMIGKEGNPLVDYSQLNLDDIKSHMIYFDYAKKYQDYITKALSSEDSDKFWDFVEADLCDSTTSEPKDKIAKANASRSLSPARSSHSFYNMDSNSLRFPWVTDFINAVSDFRDSDPEFEKKMLQFLASRVRAVDSSILGSVCDRIQSKYPISYLYITDDILRQHKDALLDIYGDDYTSHLLDKGLLGAEPVAIETAPEPTGTSVNNLIAQATELEEEIVSDSIDKETQDEDSEDKSEEANSKDKNSKEDIPNPFNNEELPDLDVDKLVIN